MRISSILATALAACVVVACGGDGPATPEDPEALRSPVGEFTLATVNGENVPMLWDQMDLAGGGTLKAYWNGGSIQFRADSSFALSYRHTLTGPRLPGTVQEDKYEGTWRLASGARIELRRKSGGVMFLQTSDPIYSVTQTSSVPSLDGGTEQVVFVFVRK
jgi:hypothetical protein